MRQALTILGIDPGLAAAGWGLIRIEGTRLTHLGNGLIESHKSEDLPQRLLGLFRSYQEVLTRTRPDCAAVEETFVNSDHRSALKLAQARGIALLAPAEADIPVAEYAPNLIKKSVTGLGHAKKEQVRMMVERLLPGAEIASEHAADALAVAITHAHHAGMRARLSLSPAP